MSRFPFSHDFILFLLEALIVGFFSLFRYGQIGLGFRMMCGNEECSRFCNGVKLFVSTTSLLLLVWEKRALTAWAAFVEDFCDLTEAF